MFISSAYAPNETPPDVAAPEVIQILEGARVILEQNEWTQHSYARISKRRFLGVFTKAVQSFCLIGAVQKAADGDPYYGTRFSSAANKQHYKDAYRTIHRSIIDLYPPNRFWGNPERWNDAKAESKEEVLEVLDHAIALAKGQL